MTHTIATLHPIETVQFDHAALAALCAAEGLQAEATITEALGDVERLISMIATQQHHRNGLMRTCTELVRVAQRIGMTTIRDGARAILICIAQGNETALAACTARLVRLGQPKQIGGWTMEPSQDTIA